MYIDTENTFRTERIVQMAEGLNLEPEDVVKKIIFAEAYTSDHQIFLLEKADKVIKENNISLIIVDSLTSHFRSEYLGREMLAERQQKLNKHMHKLIRLARAFNAVAVVTNQVMSKPDVFFGEAVHPVGRITALGITTLRPRAVYVNPRIVHVAQGFTKGDVDRSSVVGRPGPVEGIVRIVTFIGYGSSVENRIDGQGRPRNRGPGGEQANRQHYCAEAAARQPWT